MKIAEIKLKNFRAYNDEVIKIQKEIILLYGNNGLGKTSFFDAIEWGITGKLERYDGPNEERNRNKFLKNKFSNENDEGKVTINFTDGTSIERKIKEEKNSDYNSGITESNIEDILIKKEFKLEKINIQTDFVPLHLLSQALLDSFIRNKKSQERYEIFIKMFGLSKYKEIENKVKKHTDILNKEYDKKRETEEILEETLKKNSNKIIEYNQNKYEEFIKLNIPKISRNEILNIKEDILEKYMVLKNYNREEVKEIKRKLDEINFLLEKNRKNKKIKELYSKKKIYKTYEILKELGLDKKREILMKEASFLEKIKKDTLLKKIEFLNLEKELKRLTKLNCLNENLNNELIFLKNNTEKVIREKREFIISTKTYLKNLQKIDSCPVCGNMEFNLDVVINSLDVELKKDRNELSDLILSKEQKIEKVKKLLEILILKIDAQLENKLQIIENKLSRIEKNINKLRQLKSEYFEIEINLKKLNIIKFSDLKNLLTKFSINEEFLIKEKIKLENEIENIFPKKINIDELKDGKDKELEIEIKKNQKKLLVDIENYLLNLYINSVKQEKELSDIKKEKLQIKEKRDSLEEFVRSIKILIEKTLNKKSSKIEKAIQKIYRCVNPHYSFKSFSLDVKKYEKKNNGMDFYIEDSATNVGANPAYVFSSAQNNLLALSIFLGFSCQEKWSKLDSLFLDDPIQSLDDINIYSFIDILISISKRTNKQIFISTHDENIKKLIEKKLGKEKLQIIELKSYGRIKLEGE